MKYGRLLILLAVCSSLFGKDFVPSLDHVIMGIYVVDSKTGQVMMDKNSKLSLVPASCMKLVTTGAALQILGADTRFETWLEYDGEIDCDKTLKGNLYIRGGGDPCLGSGRVPGSLSWEQQISVWAGRSARHRYSKNRG